MPTINELSTTDSLSVADQIAIWQTNNGDTRKASLNTLLDFIKQNSEYSVLNTQSDLKSVAVDSYRLYQVLGKTTINDNEGGSFYWDPNSVELADDFLIVESNNTSTGRWIRLRTSSIYVVDTIADLPVNPNEDDVCEVRDLDRGGIFIFKASEIPNSDEGTNINGWLRQYHGQINVKWFGAKGDNITDDTTAIQKALDKKSIVFVPKGEYLITSSLVVYDGVTIIGEGIDSTMIKESGNSDDFTISMIINENRNSSIGNENIAIKNMSLYGKNATPISDGSVSPNNKGVGGVYLGYCINSTVENVFFKDGWSGIVFFGDKEGFSSTINNKAVNCVVLNAASWSANGNTGVPRGFNLSTSFTELLNCKSTSCATGFFIGGSNAYLTDCTAKNWTFDNGYYVLGSNHSFLGCKALGNNFGNGFALAYGSRNKLTNCTATGCSNMGFRLHAPFRNSNLANCLAENCGYGVRAENTLVFPVSSITSVGTTVTVTLVDAVDLELWEVGAGIYISGANEVEYNGTWKITGIAGNNITYECDSAPSASPATGTLNVDSVLSNTNITNIVVKDSAQDGVELHKSYSIQLTGLYLEKTGLAGVEVFESKEISIANINLYDTTEWGLFFSTAKNCNVTNAVLNECKSAPDTGGSRGAIYFNNCKNLQVNNANISTPQSWSIYGFTTIGSNENCSFTNIQSDKLAFPTAGTFISRQGTGTPEGVEYGAIGNVFYRTDGGASTTLYVKESNPTGNTGWVAK